MKKINVKSISLFTIISMFSIVLMTIISELHKPLKNLLAQTFSHHWIGKGVVAMLLFVILILTLGKSDLKGSKDQWINAVTISSIIGFAIILVFYIIEFFLL